MSGLVLVVRPGQRISLVRPVDNKEITLTLEQSPDSTRAQLRIQAPAEFKIGRLEQVNERTARRK